MQHFNCSCGCWFCNHCGDIAEYKCDELFCSCCDIYEIKEKKIQVGMFTGRHDIPVDKYIFNGEYSASPREYTRVLKDANEFFKSLESDIVIIDIYVTGLTIGIIAIFEVYHNLGLELDLNLFHYDLDTGEYIQAGKF